MGKHVVGMLVNKTIKHLAVPSSRSYSTQYAHCARNRVTFPNLKLINSFYLCNIWRALHLIQRQHEILPCNYQLSKNSSWNQIWWYSCHVNINNLPYIVKGILVLIGSLRCLKVESQWTWCYLFSVYFKIGFHDFSNIYCWYTLELPLEAIPMCTYRILCPFNKWVFFTIKQFFSQTSQLQYNHNEHVEINKFLCSLACTWMTIINSQFYIIDS